MCDQPLVQFKWRWLVISFCQWLSLVSPVQAYTNIFELEFHGRRILVSILYSPNKNLDLEREIANQTSTFVAEVFEERGVVQAVDRRYEFSQHERVLFTFVNLEEVDVSTPLLSAVFKEENIIGSLELVYSMPTAIEDLPLMRRIKGWASEDIYQAAIKLLMPAESGSAMVQARRYAVRKDSKVTTGGTLLAYLAVIYGMESDTLKSIPDWKFTNISTVVAEAKAGSRARIYGALGMIEVLNIARDLDFTDNRGLSLLRGTPSELKLRTSAILNELDLLPLKIRRPELGWAAKHELEENNMRAANCDDAFKKPRT